MHLPHILHGAKAPLTRLVTLRKACTRSCRGSKGSIERGQSRAYNLRTYTCRQNGSHGGSQRYPIVSSHSCEQFVYITTMAAISREIGPSCFVARCPRCPLAQARPISHAPPHPSICAYVVRSHGGGNTKDFIGLMNSTSTGLLRVASGTTYYSYKIFA